MRIGAARRPSVRHAGPDELATALECALAGEPVPGARASLMRRIRRAASRRPYATTAALVLLAASLVLAAILSIESWNDARTRAVALAAERERLATDAREALAKLPPFQEAFAREIDQEKAALAELASLETEPDPANPWGPKQTPDLAPTRKDLLGRIAESALASRIALDQIVRLGTVASASRLVADAVLSRNEADHALTRYEEERDLSTRTLGQFKDVTGRIEVGHVPRGTRATIRAVENGSGLFVLGDPEPIASGDSLDVPVGEYLLVLEGDGREVRHAVLVSPGESYEWKPDWPREFPRTGDFVYIPPGRFRAGGDGENAGPYRAHTTAHGYFIARHETTLEEYLEYLADLARGRDASALEAALPRYHHTTGTDDFVDRELRVTPGYDSRMPMGGLSQRAALSYARWRTLRERDGFEYDLPTEAEWEHAARGAAGRTYPWGDRWEPGRANTIEREKARGAFYFTRVGEMAGDVSLFGLADVAGNVREWTSSDYGFDLVAIRGGAFRIDGGWARVAARGGGRPDLVYANYGVRLVCRPPEAR